METIRAKENGEINMWDICAGPIVFHLNRLLVLEALDIGKTRSGRHNDEDTLNSVNYFEKLGLPGYWRHFIGALVEVAYREYFGWKILTVDCADGDCGIDFEDGTQAKGAMQEGSPNLLFPISQWLRMLEKIIPTRYILGWAIPEGRIYANRFQSDLYKVIFIGQISHDDAVRLKYIVEEGDRNTQCDTYWVDREHLCFHNLHKLKKGYVEGDPAWPDDVHRKKGLI